MGINERRSREKENMVSLILTSAEELIIGEGFKNFTLSKLSEKIEFSRGIIYYYFKNEENIIAKLISGKMYKLLEELNKIPEEKDGFSDVKAIIERFRIFLLEDEPHYLTLISYFTSRKLGSNDKVSVPFYIDYENFRDALFTKCLIAIDKGVKDGSIIPGIDPYVIAYCIWAQVGSFWEYMMKDNVLRPLKEPYSKQVHVFISSFFTLIYRALKA